MVVQRAVFDGPADYAHAGTVVSCICNASSSSALPGVSQDSAEQLRSFDHEAKQSKATRPAADRHFAATQRAGMQMSDWHSAYLRDERVVEWRGDHGAGQTQLTQSAHGLRSLPCTSRGLLTLRVSTGAVHRLGPAIRRSR